MSGLVIGYFDWEIGLLDWGIAGLMIGLRDW
jgi:hypothetical protein